MRELVLNLNDVGKMLSTINCFISFSRLQRQFLLLSLPLHVEFGHQPVGKEPKETNAPIKNYMCVIIYSCSMGECAKSGLKGCGFGHCSFLKSIKQTSGR